MITFKQFDYKKWILWSTVTCEVLNAEDLFISKNQIKEYLKEHKMPKDKKYSEEDLIYDLTKSSGSYCLPAGTKKSTAEFVAELISDLL